MPAHTSDIVMELAGYKVVDMIDLASAGTNIWIFVVAAQFCFVKHLLLLLL